MPKTLNRATRQTFILLGFALLLGILFPETAAGQTTRSACSGEAVIIQGVAGEPLASEIRQWQVNRNDGRGFVPAPGTNSNRDYTFTATLEDNSNLYRERYLKKNGNISFTSSTTILTVNTLPNAPTAAGKPRCGGTTLTAEGSTGNYRWYDTESSTNVLAGGSNYSPSISATRDYYVAAVNTSGCESPRVKVTAAVYATPSAPVATEGSRYDTGAVTLTASGTPAGGSYRWYTLAAGGNAISGATADRYTTPSISITTTYYVSAVSAQGCEGPRAAVRAIITTDQYQLNSDAVKTGENCFMLTPASQYKHGEVWGTSPVDLSKSFEITFSVNFGSIATGADGIALGFQRQSPNPLSAVGRDGEALGFGGITPSVAIEFDTYRNTGEPSFDHTAFFLNGNQGSPIADTQVQLSSSKTNVKDGQNHLVRVIWLKETNTMEVYFDGVFRTRYTADMIGSLFGNNPLVYFGFTASTGQLSNVHSVCNIQYNIAPEVTSMTSAALLSKPVAQAISALQATDADGIKSYTLVTLPGSGILYVDGRIATAGQVLTPTQAGQLTFKPADNFTGSVSFTYTATDNLNLTDASPATYTIPVNSNLDFVLASSVLTAGPYSAGQSVTIRFTLTNAGTTGAGAQIQNLLSDKLEFSGVTGAATNYDSNSNVYTVQTLAAGTSYSFDVTARLRALPFEHTTTAYAANGVTETNTANNSTRYVISSGPTVEPVETELDPNNPEPQPITPLYAWVKGGTIGNYMILTLPDPASGKLLVNGKEAAAGQTLTPEEAGQLTFQQAIAFTEQHPTFTYTATDNFGIMASRPGVYTLRRTPIAPLPVTLMSFTAQAGGGQVLLSWATASEVNNEYFAVERSLNGKTFEQVARVKGAGNSSVRLDYTLLDRKVPPGVMYYRLRQVDFDGQYEYSKIVAVRMQEAATQVKLYPNPAVNTLFINLMTLPKGVYTLRVVSMDGRMVKQAAVSGATEEQVDVSQLPKGTYVLQLQGADLASFLKFIKQ